MTVTQLPAGALDIVARIQRVNQALASTPDNGAGADVDFATVLQAATGSIAPAAPAPVAPADTGAGSGTGASAGYDPTAYLTASSLGLPTGTNPLSGTSTVNGTTPATGNDVVADAVQYLGVPYQWGGTDPATGLDCSGLTQRVYADLGYQLPRVSYDQATVGTPVDSLADAQPGDLLFFGSPVHHVAIYAGNDQMVEAPHTGEDVRVSTVDETPTHIRRILGDTSLMFGGQATQATSPAASPRVVTGTATAGTTPFASIFADAAARTGVPVSLLTAVAQQESGFDPSAVSPAGAQGLMQLMPSTARGLGVTNPFDPTQAINGAAGYLKSLLSEFNGNTSFALAAYNAGPGAVLKYGGVPPYAETQRYVQSVESLMEAQ